MTWTDSETASVATAPSASAEVRQESPNRWHVHVEVTSGPRLVGLCRRFTSRDAGKAAADAWFERTAQTGGAR